MYELRSVLLENDGIASEEDLAIDLLHLNELRREITDDMEKVIRLGKIESSLEETVSEIEIGELSRNEFHRITGHLDYLLTEIGYEKITPSLEDFDNNSVSLEGIKDKITKVKNFLSDQVDKISLKLNTWFKRKNQTVEGMMSTIDKLSVDLEKKDSSQSVTVKANGDVIFPKNGNLSDTSKSIDVSHKELNAWFNTKVIKRIDDYQSSITDVVDKYGRDRELDIPNVVKDFSSISKKFYDDLDKVSTISPRNYPNKDEGVTVTERTGMMGNKVLMTVKSTESFKYYDKDVNGSIQSLMHGVISFDMSMAVRDDVSGKNEKIDVEVPDGRIVKEILEGLSKVLNVIKDASFHKRKAVILPNSTIEAMEKGTSQWPKYPKTVNDILKFSSEFVIKPKLDMAQFAINDSYEIIAMCRRAVSAFN